MGVRQTCVTWLRSAGSAARPLAGRVAGRAAGVCVALRGRGSLPPGRYTDLSNTS
jgi:hypothetical protein